MINIVCTLGDHLNVCDFHTGDVHAHPRKGRMGLCHVSTFRCKWILLEHSRTLLVVSVTLTFCLLENS